MKGVAVALLAILTAAVGIRWGSFVAGGSDSYCYVYQAERWADAIRDPFAGRLQEPEPLALEAPWPGAALTFAPVGHTPSRTVPGAIAPICPSGLSLVMAPFVLAGGRDAAFLVVPLFGALLVVATYVVGSRFGAHVGVASALAVAASPVGLYQVVQPMSDVPAAALWMLAVAWATGTGRRHALASGLAASGAILMRPNLVPLGVVIGVYLLLRPERTARQRVVAGARYAAASAIGCLAVAAIQQTFFASPFASGYGSFDELFAAANIPVNARNFGGWLLATHTPAVALALLAPVLLPGPLTMLFLALCAVNVAVYLPYTAFGEWWYLRFLLPTIPLLLVLTMAVCDSIVGRALTAHRIRIPAVALVAMLLAAAFVREAVDRQTFRLQRLEARFERAGRYVGQRLPRNAVVLTTWHSGSVRYYGDRKTVVWDLLEPAWLDGALDYLRSRGYEPYFLFEGQEERAFRERFANSPLGALDWPPAADIGGQVRLYRPADRDAYLSGRAAPTDYVR